MWIFRAWMTTKDGQRIYAKDRGKRAFRFWVGPGPEPVKKNQLICGGLLPVGVPLVSRKEPEIWQRRKVVFVEHRIRKLWL